MADPREHGAWSEQTSAQVRAERAAAGMTQTELAERSGLPRMTVIRIETGKRVPDVQQIARLCTAFGLRMETFMMRVQERVDSVERGEDQVS